jgi:GNAT superfamily N-acetyltransferase
MVATVRLLADAPSAIEAVADMRCLEWGHPPEPTDPAWWLATTRREAGRHQLPLTWVAHDGEGEVLGAVGLDVFDLDERRETSPWVTGMIVRRDRRRLGVGRLLLEHLERWAADHGTAVVWVGTDLAEGFYRRCGWTLVESFTSNSGQEVSVLSKHLTRRR